MIFSYVRSIEDIVNDSKEFLNAALEQDSELQGKPLFVLGESMGGAASIYFALKEPALVKGIIAFCPAIKTIVLFIIEL